MEDFELEDLEEMHLSLGDRTISANRPSRRTKKAKAFGEDEFGEEEWDVDSEEDILEEEEDYAPELDPASANYVAPAPKPKKKPAAPRPRPKPRPKPKPEPRPAEDLIPEMDFEDFEDEDAGGELGRRRSRSRKISYKEFDVADDPDDDDYEARVEVGTVSRKPSIKLSVKGFSSIQRQTSKSSRAIKRSQSARGDSDDEEDYEYKPQRSTSRRSLSSQQSYDYEAVGWVSAPPKKPKSVNPYAPLNKTITAFLDKAKREAEPFRKKGWDTYYYTFYSPVPKGHYLDYNVYVPVDREIYLQTIRGKAAKYKYRSMDEFMDDVRRISENARLYHTQGEKRVAHVPELGVGLVKFMQDEVENALKANPELASPEASVPLPPIPLYMPAASGAVQGGVPGVQGGVPPQSASGVAPQANPPGPGP